MKKTITLFLFIFYAVINTQAQCTGNVYIPDANFKTALLEEHEIDTNFDGEISCNEAEAYTGVVFVNDMLITDLTGIEAFVNITKLFCGSNPLINIDVSNNTALEVLYCDSNGLTSLDVSKNPSLRDLRFNDNSLTSIDISNNLNLELLDSRTNLLTSLDISNNSLLYYFNCDSNQLTDIDISKNLDLTFFTCSLNQFTSLDLSSHALLQYLDCSSNKLTNLNIANGSNETLYYGFDALDNPDLTCIQVDDVGYSIDNWTNIDSIASFSTNCNASGCVDYVNIPDANFKAALIANTNINTDGDNEICFSEAKAFSGDIDVKSKLIKDLTGIEYFTNIVYLNCEDNELTSLDVSKNTYLETLYFGFNSITGSVDFSNNTTLKILGINSNFLETLDLTNNINLELLNCGDNLLENLDVSNGTAIQAINCSENNIKEIDVSNHPSLYYLRCQSNELERLNIANGNNVNITNINFQAQENPDLYCIQVDDVEYSIENWTNKDAIASLSEDCDSFLNCFIDIPDDSFKRALLADPLINTDGDTEIRCDEATAFTGSINIAYKPISDLTGIEAFVNITGLNCDSNDLTNLDLSNNIALEQLDCDSNDLTNLDLSNNIALEQLSCGSNDLTSLDLSNNIALTTLFCGYDNLTNLDLSNNIALNRLSCGYNDLESLDLSKNIALESLECHSNQLTSLDLSQNPILDYVECYDNQLTDLNIANGNNSNTILLALRNPDLACIQADGSASNFHVIVKDDTTSVSEDCSCYVNIPDDNFKVALVSNTLINTDGDTEISCEEATNFTGIISVSGMGISNLTGIEAFTNLTQLFCDFNSLTALDLSKNTALTKLSCNFNSSLTSLNVANGNNDMIEGGDFYAIFNASLECIQVDDVAYSSANWFFKDNTASYSTNCNAVTTLLQETRFSSKETSSILNTKFAETVSVYPIPVINTLNIGLNTDDELEEVVVYNLLGKVLLTAKTTSVNMNNLAQGLYVLKIKSTNGEELIRKIIKSNN